VTINNGNDLRGRIGQIESLVAALEGCADREAQAQARAVVGALLDFHGAALAGLLSHVSAAGTPGRAIIEALARDELVSSMLLLHGLHPDELEVRVARALEEVRPGLHSHGGDVELLGIDHGVVRLRMKGSCHGCPSSARTLAQSIETAIYDAAPDVSSIEVEEAAEIAGAAIPPLVTIGPLGTAH
jgi:Fe-S cluster biogenesis protein NfuA